MKCFICVGYNGACGIGLSLDLAWQAYKDNTGDDDISDCNFYVAEKVEIEQKLIIKETIVKTNTTKVK